MTFRMDEVRYVRVGTDLDAYEFDAGQLTDEIRARLMWHGLQQKLADSRAGMNRNTKDYSPDKAQALVDKVAANLIAGEWGRERGGGNTMNRLDARIMKLCREKVRDAVKAKGMKVKDLADGVFDAKVAEYYEKAYETLRPVAEAQLAAERAAKATEVDIDFDV